MSKTTPNPPNPKTPMQLSEILRGTSHIVIGGTGFLGKVWLSLLLHRFPDIKHLYLLVRPKKTMTTEQRFWKEIVPSDSLAPLRVQHGDKFEEFIRSKITPISGDVSYPNIGINDDFLKQHKGKIDSVVNVSGVVDFMPPIDEALHVNCFGVKHLIQLCKTLGDVPVLHTSTCYVAGGRDGTFLEIDPRQRPFPRYDEIDPMHWDPEREIEEGLRLVERATHEANEAFRQSEFLEQAKERLRERGESCRGRVLEDELKRVKRKYVEGMLRDEGQKRAKYWGWTNTYTYTKSIGEQLLLNSGLRATIVRPAIIESSSFYPMPGWNEGINTSAPLIYAMLYRGIPFIPGSWECNLDIIPNDLVCSGMIASLGALINNSHKTVYQFGAADVNPVSTARLQELTSLYKHRSLRKNPKGNPLFNAIQKMYGTSPLTPDEYNRIADPAFSRITGQLSDWSAKAAVLPGLGFLKETSKTLKGISKTLEKSADITRQFLPFMYERHYCFDCSNTRELLASLSPEDRAKLYWEPEEINWRDWWLKVHIPGIEKWVVPLIEEKLRKTTKPLRAYSNLVAMMEEVVDNNPYAVCMQRLKDERLETMIYREFRQQAHRAALWLQSQGIQKGDRVLLSGKNGPMWPVAYFGILKAGGVAVPLDPALDTERIQNLYRSSKAKFGFWDQEFQDECGHVLHKPSKSKSQNTKQVSFSALLFEDLAQLDGPTDDLVEISLEEDDLASLIFTSGTTGEPKGVMLSHKNFASMLSSLVPLFPLDQEDSSLSLLPLHHTFEFTCGLLLPFSRGARITYVEELSGEQIVTALKVAKVTSLVGVPALWQLLAKRIRSQLKQRGTVVSTAFDALAKANRSIGKTLGMDLGKVIFAPVHQQLGGHLKYLISGGSALPSDTQELFISLGLPLTEGYGLTEAAPVLTVAKASRGKTGHVGKAIPGVEIKLHNTNPEGIGEVIARGPNVMRGYDNNPKATAEVLMEEGWLRTGDLGKIDHKGRLTLVGRAKEVIITSNGENVYPDDLEDLIGLPPSVEELVVLGITNPNGGEQVAVLAVPKKKESNKPKTKVEKKAQVEQEELAFAKRVGQARSELQEAFAKLPQHSRPTVLHFQKDLLPRTATRKVKRKEVRVTLEKLEEQRQSSDQFVPLSKQIVDALVKITGAKRDVVLRSNRLATDLGIDSLMMGELHTELESVLRQTIPIQRLSQCESVAAIQALLSDLHIETSHEVERWKEEEDDETIQVPNVVRRLAKQAIGQAQETFYKQWMRVKVYGRANIPHNRNTLLVANHNSHLDLGLIKYALGKYGEDLSTLGAKDYFFEGNKWKTTYFDNFTNVIPFDRKGNLEDSLADARSALRRGRSLLLFPEGTRSKTGVMGPFRAGIGVLARDVDIDILPIFTEGSYESMPKGRPVPTKRRLVVRIGEVIPSTILRQKTEGLEPKEAARLISQIAQSAVESLRDRTPFDLEGWAPITQEEKPMGLKDLFAYLDDRFDSQRVEEPVSFYFSLGSETNDKWSLIVEKESCMYHQGKPANGVADCVLKTSPEIFRQIVTESYVPSPDLFLSGAIKSNNIPLLQQFVQIFDL